MTKTSFRLGTQNALTYGMISSPYKYHSFQTPDAFQPLEFTHKQHKSESTTLIEVESSQGHHKSISQENTLRKMPWRLGGYANELSVVFLGSLLEKKDFLYKAGWGLMYGYALTDVINQSLQGWRKHSSDGKTEQRQSALHAGFNTAVFHGINSALLPTLAVMGIKKSFKEGITKALTVAQAKFPKATKGSMTKNLIDALERTAKNKKLMASGVALLSLPVLSKPIDLLGTFGIELTKAIARHTKSPEENPNPFASLSEGVNAASFNNPL